MNRLDVPSMDNKGQMLNMWFENCKKIDFIVAFEYGHKLGLGYPLKFGNRHVTKLYAKEIRG